MGGPLTVGVVGCGKIAGAYFDTFARIDQVALTAVADLDPARAAAAAEATGARALTVEELLASEVELVLNLTIPAAHAEVARAAIAAGKSVYGEKPLAATTTEAREMLAAAEAAGVTLGCAPDTVLGTGVQTARQVIDRGDLGQPIAATAVMTTSGHEAWHPDPDFYYQPGGGPLLDMGPYYVTALVQLLGPVVAVIGAGSRTRDSRVIGSGPRAGTEIPVAVDTHVTGVLRHAGGALSTLVMSFDSAATHAVPIEVHGPAGTLSVPDPNGFAGQVQLRAPRTKEWIDIDPSAGYLDAARGYGVADLAAGTNRAGGAMALHVLDIMESLLRSAETRREESVETTVERPSLVPLGGLD